MVQNSITPCENASCGAPARRMRLEEAMARQKAIFAVIVMAAFLCTPSLLRAQNAADHEAVRNHVTCYPFGIDKIGRGDNAAGIALWKECFAPDFEFSAFIGRGEPTNCPGSNCPFSREMSSIDMRAAFARRAFDAAGFVKTSHHLTNMTVSFASADQASVNAYVQAWHWKADGTVVVAPGTWDVELARGGDQWRIVKEKLAVVGAAVIPPPAR
jgi:SnoaL-like domain